MLMCQVCFFLRKYVTLSCHLLQVIWKRLFDTSSGMDVGTLYHLRNLVNRRNVTKQVKSDVNANEDFLELCVTGYILVAVMSFLGMTAIEDSPHSSIVSPDSWMEEDLLRSTTLMKIADAIVEKYVDLEAEFCDPSQPQSSSQDSSNHNYGKEVISLGLLFLNFKDAVREGDGDRVLRMWKYFLLLFRATGHTNYAMEALTLLLQCNVFLPPNLAEQIKWSRFINVHGQLGRNISCDLHMEHLNRIIKSSIEGLGSNKSEKAIVRAGKCVGKFMKVLTAYDKQAGLLNKGGDHSEKSYMKDLHQIIDQLCKSNVLNTCTHKSFSKLKPNLIRTLSETELKGWILDNVCNYTSCH